MLSSRLPNCLIPTIARLADLDDNRFKAPEGEENHHFRMEQ